MSGCFWESVQYVCDLGDVMLPTEICASLLDQLKEFANVDDSITDTRKLAAIAFLYLFCSITPVNGFVHLHSFNNSTCKWFLHLHSFNNYTCQWVCTFTFI